MFVIVNNKSSFTADELLKRQNDIVFIKDTQEIWTHGTYFTIPDSYVEKITTLENSYKSKTYTITGSDFFKIGSTNTFSATFGDLIQIKIGDILKDDNGKTALVTSWDTSNIQGEAICFYEKSDIIYISKIKFYNSHFSTFYYGVNLLQGEIEFVISGTSVVNSKEEISLQSVVLLYNTYDAKFDGIENFVGSFVGYAEDSTAQIDGFLCNCKGIGTYGSESFPFYSFRLQNNGTTSKLVGTKLASYSDIESVKTDVATNKSEITKVSNLLDAWTTRVTKLIDGANSKTNTHIADKANPHEVTKEQVGLGNVDNTSDTDKPISTATQTALDNKVDKTNLKTVNGTSIIGTGDVSTIPSKIPDNTVIELDNGSMKIVKQTSGDHTFSSLSFSETGKVYTSYFDAFQANFGATYEKTDSSGNVKTSKEAVRIGLTKGLPIQASYVDITNNLGNSMFMSKYGLSSTRQIVAYSGHTNYAPTAATSEKLYHFNISPGVLGSYSTFVANQVSANPGVEIINSSTYNGIKLYNRGGTSNGIVWEGKTSNDLITANGGTFDISTVTTSLGNKVDAVTGKGLSTNDYTTDEKTKLAGIAENANNYTLPKATATVLGGVTVGKGITLTDGKITVSDATTSSSGLLSSADKIKLDNLENLTKYTTLHYDSAKNIPFQSGSTTLRVDGRYLTDQASGGADCPGGEYGSFLTIIANGQAVTDILIEEGGQIAIDRDGNRWEPDGTKWNKKFTSISIESEVLPNSTNPVQSKALYKVITDNEQVTAAALSDLDERLSKLLNRKRIFVKQYASSSFYDGMQFYVTPGETIDFAAMRTNGTTGTCTVASLNSSKTAPTMTVGTPTTIESMGSYKIFKVSMTIPADVEDGDIYIYKLTIS